MDTKDSAPRTAPPKGLLVEEIQEELLTAMNEETIATIPLAVYAATALLERPADRVWPISRTTHTLVFPSIHRFLFGTRLEAATLERLVCLVVTLGLCLVLPFLHRGSCQCFRDVLRFCGMNLAVLLLGIWSLPVWRRLYTGVITPKWPGDWKDFEYVGRVRVLRAQWLHEMLFHVVYGALRLLSVSLPLLLVRFAHSAAAVS